MLVPLLVLAVQAAEPAPPPPAAASASLDRQHRDALPDEAFAFAAERKEPLTDARHVRSAVARFRRVKGVSDAERDEAWRRIQAAARKFGVELREQSWRELGKGEP